MLQDARWYWRLLLNLAPPESVTGRPLVEIAYITYCWLFDSFKQE